MIKNFQLSGFRSLMKNKLSTGINILGISVAVGCCIVCFSFIDWSFHQDDFHSKKDNLYVVERIIEKNGDDHFIGNSPAAMGPQLLSENPQIKDICRLNYRYSGVVFQSGEKTFKEEVTFTDPSFLSMFDFPIKWGNASDFKKNNNTIILTEELSKKVFGQKNSIGENITISFTEDEIEQVETFEIVAVTESRPFEASFYFNCIIPFDKQLSLGKESSSSWDSFVNMTFIETENEADIARINTNQQKYVDTYNSANKEDLIKAFHFQPLRSMNTHSYLVDNQRFLTSHIAGLILLGFISLVIALMVCFNYMNISIASATSRFKEISVRKVLGSNRKQIIFQFLLENLIVCSFGILLGYVLAATVFLPWFNNLSGLGDELTAYVMNNYRSYLMLLILLPILILGGAAYPAIYISSLEPLAILKKTSGLRQKNGFRKVLVGMQLLFTMIAISIALSVRSEGNKLLQESWGYDQSNTVVVNLEGAKDYELLKSKLEQEPSVESVSGSKQPLGYWQNRLSLIVDGEEKKAENLHFTSNFMADRGIEIVAGRDFDKSNFNDKNQSILVNQKFRNMMGWETAVGKTVNFNEKNYQIVGETNDFRCENFLEIEPLIIQEVAAGNITYLYVKVKESFLGQPSHAPIEAAWKKLYPSIPFEYHYQESVFDDYFSSFKQVNGVMAGVCFITILLSILGLFGLTFLVLGKKMKEISIKKIIGASNGAITFLLIKEFLVALVIAAFIGAPLAYWVSNQILQILNPLSNTTFYALLNTFIIVFFMIIVSVSYHIYKALTANPVEFLREN